MSTTGQTYYTAAREELVARLKLREQILNYFVVAAGAIFGVAISDVNGMGSTVVLIIPLIALGTAILITAHTMVITNIARHTYSLNKAINRCRRLSLEKSIREASKDTDTEEVIENKVKEIFENTKMTPWDWSETYKQSGMWSSRIRILGNYLIFVPSVILALYLGYAQIGYFENQRALILKQKEESQNITITNIKEAVKSGSDNELFRILLTQNNKPKILDELDEKINIHIVLFYSSSVASFLMAVFIIVGHRHRQRWVREIP